MVIKNNEIHIEHPVRKGDVLELNGNQYTTNDLESLETTLTEEQIKGLTDSDRMKVIYSCQFIDKKEVEGITHQLLRILLRMCNTHKLNLKKILYENLLDENSSRMFNEDTKLSDDEYDEELSKRTLDEMYLWIRELVVN